MRTVFRPKDFIVVVWVGNVKSTSSLSGHVHYQNPSRNLRPSSNSSSFLSAPVCVCVGLNPARGCTSTEDLNLASTTVFSMPRTLPGAPNSPTWIICMSHSLNSLKGGYIGDCIGDYYRGY